MRYAINVAGLDLEKVGWALRMRVRVARCSAAWLAIKGHAPLVNRREQGFVVRTQLASRASIKVCAISRPGKRRRARSV